MPQLPFYAIRIRNHVIEMFERADREPDASQRAPFLSFVIAGGDLPESSWPVRLTTSPAVFWPTIQT